MDKIKKLKVLFNGKVVGYLAETTSKEIAFQYDESWIKSGFSISPFSLPLTDKIYISDSVNFNGLYGVFQDSLPDGWGELLVKRMLARKGIDYDKLSPLTKLTLIGGNGLGALTFEPTQAESTHHSNIDLDKIAKETAKILNDEHSEAELDNIYNLGGSSGGARPKAHLTLNNEEWIVKFACIIDPKNIGEQEFKANTLAKKCGINVNVFKLFESKLTSGFFGSKRFDRNNSGKVHMISLSSLLETTHRVPNLDYMHLFQVIDCICDDKENILEAYRRMCFNVLFANRDDHGKNFSFIYDEKTNSYKLSPAYDTTQMKNKPEHEMSVLGNRKPTEKDLVKVAKQLKFSLEKCEEIIEITKKVIQE